VISDGKKVKEWVEEGYYFRFLINTNFKTTLFADDTILHLSNSNLQQLQTEVSQEINKVDV